MNSNRESKVDLGFNTTLVQLKVEPGQSFRAAVNQGFNTTLVQLKVYIFTRAL